MPATKDEEDGDRSRRARARAPHAEALALAAQTTDAFAAATAAFERVEAEAKAENVRPPETVRARSLRVRRASTRKERKPYKDAKGYLRPRGALIKASTEPDPLAPIRRLDKAIRTARF